MTALIEVSGEVAGADGVVGIDQVEDGEIAQKNLAEEQDGLEADVGPELFVAGLGGEELGIGGFVGGQFTRAKPLFDETLGELERPVVAEHAAGEFVEDLGILELAGGRGIEQELVGHAAPEEVREAGGHGVLIHESGFGAGVGGFGAERGTRGRPARRGRRRGRRARRPVPVFARRGRAGHKSGNFGFVNGTAERTRQERRQNLVRGLIGRDAWAWHDGEESWRGI